MAKPPQQEIDGRSIAGQVAGAMGSVPTAWYGRPMASPQHSENNGLRLGSREYELQNLPTFQQWLTGMGLDLARVPDADKPGLYAQYQQWLKEKKEEIEEKYPTTGGQPMPGMRYGG